MIRYCTQCITPSSRPHIAFDAEGVCNACRAHGTRKDIDWKQRAESFRSVVENAKARRAAYDCLIPVSGGKDSTWQVVQCLKSGLRPLAVTWKPPFRTDIGARNLANLIGLGVDHMDFQVNPRVEKKFLLASYIKYGSTAIPMHMALFNIPLMAAVRYDIPLVVWGENSAFEYGGREDERYGFRLNSDWVKRYGVTQGTTAADWVSDELSWQDLTPYQGPTDAELDAKRVSAVFLGYYFPWDPETSLQAAIAHGFKPRAEGPKTGYYDYADIDDDFISIHHYLKWYKFGFTRLFDNLSLEIRNGRMTRRAAIDVVRRRGDETPLEDIRKFCGYVGITEKRFFEIAETFRNPEVWTRRNGRWVIEGFLVDGWDWRPS